MERISKLVKLLVVIAVFFLLTCSAEKGNTVLYKNYSLFLNGKEIDYSSAETIKETLPGFDLPKDNGPGFYITGERDLMTFYFDNKTNVPFQITILVNNQNRPVDVEINGIKINPTMTKEQIRKMAKQYGLSYKEDLIGEENMQYLFDKNSFDICVFSFRGEQLSVVNIVPQYNDIPALKR